MTEVKAPKALPVHKDKLGRLLELDDYVAYPSRNSLDFGKVIKINNKMIKVVKVPMSRYTDNGSNKYPHDTVKVDPKDMTWYLLKNPK